MTVDEIHDGFVATLRLAGLPCHRAELDPGCEYHREIHRVYAERLPTTLPDGDVWYFGRWVSSIGEGYFSIERVDAGYFRGWPPGIPDTVRLSYTRASSGYVGETAYPRSVSQCGSPAIVSLPHS